MKTRLNIICILIFITIAASIGNFFIGDFAKGFKEGWNEAEAELEAVKKENIEEHIPLFLFYRASQKEYVHKDSLYDKHSQTYLTAEYSDVTVKVRDVPNKMLRNLLTVLFSLIILIAAIVELIYFVRLINAINHNIIFDWRNVVKLRIIGIAMLIVFFTAAAFTYYSINAAGINVEIEGYERVTKGIWKFSILLPALGILLAAEIFSIGLKLKEEQELTI